MTPSTWALAIFSLGLLADIIIRLISWLSNRAVSGQDEKFITMKKYIDEIKEDHCDRMDKIDVHVTATDREVQGIKETQADHRLTIERQINQMEKNIIQSVNDLSNKVAALTKNN